VQCSYRAKRDYYLYGQPTRFGLGRRRSGWFTFVQLRGALRRRSFGLVRPGSGSLLALLLAHPARWEEVERSTLCLEATVWFGPFVIHQKN
jgi:hypothetical protein